MTMNEVEQKIFEEAMTEEVEFLSYMEEEMIRKMKKYGFTLDDFSQYLEDCICYGFTKLRKREIRKILLRLKNERQEVKKSSKIKAVYIDQWTVGESGDSYAGHIYFYMKDENMYMVNFEL